MPLTSLALSRHGDKSYCSMTTVTIQIPRSWVQGERATLCLVLLLLH